VFARQLLDAAFEAADTARQKRGEEAIDRRGVLDASQDIVLGHAEGRNFLRQLADAHALDSFEIMEHVREAA
jgi:hypothetical protein